MRQTNIYTFIFVIIIALVSAFALSSVSQSLKDRQIINIENDMKKNILIVLGVFNNGECLGTADKEDICDVACCYNKFIKSFAVDYEGKISDNADPERINLENELEKPENERLYPVFVKSKSGKIDEYCYPVIGKGVWATIYGYIALKNDLNTVSGITFYKHEETPGLGAEIEKKWFQDNFKGKKIFNEKNELVSVTVVKGRIKQDSKNIIHMVDGISGATRTGDGVTKLIEKSLGLYEPYLKRLRKEME